LRRFSLPSHLRLETALLLVLLLPLMLPLVLLVLLVLPILLWRHMGFLSALPLCLFVFR